MQNGQKGVRNKLRVRNTYAPLRNWLAFINEEEDEWGYRCQDITGVPPNVIEAYGADGLREQARAFLMKVAKAPTGERIEGPPRIYRKQGSHLIPGESVFSNLLDALESRDLNRLLICPECKRLYLALMSNMEVCSAKCRQKKHYRENLEKERKKARRKMRKRRREAKAVAKQQRNAWIARMQPLR